MPSHGSEPLAGSMPESSFRFTFNTRIAMRAPTAVGPVTVTCDFVGGSLARTASGVRTQLTGSRILVQNTEAPPLAAAGS
jgi:hypothetical protein